MERKKSGKLREKSPDSSNPQSSSGKTFIGMALLVEYTRAIPFLLI
jgi:hypothetical protein